MPFFDYRCKSCGQSFEKLVHTRPGPSVLECPTCGTMTATRQLSTFSTARRSDSGSPSPGCAPSGGG